MSKERKRLHSKEIADILEFVNVIGSSADDAARILRLHATSEFFLERIICLHMSNGSTLTEDERFTYYHKLQIVIALGALDSATVGTLRKLSKLRNRCAHERRPLVTGTELMEIGSIFGSPFAKAASDFEGENREFRALAWAIFTNLSRQITPFEIAREQLRNS